MTSIPIRTTTPLAPGSLPSWEDQIRALLPVGVDDADAAGDEPRPRGAMRRR